MKQIFNSLPRPVVCALLLLMSSVLLMPHVYANSVRIFNLSEELWARPRSGAVIPHMEPLKLAVAYWESGTDVYMMLSYPGGDSGEIWASELKDWLVSLGIPSQFILLSAGFQVEDEIKILVGSRQELIK